MRKGASKTFLAILYLGAVLLPSLIEHGGEIVQHVTHERGFERTIFKASFWYQRLITLGYRKPYVHAVTLVPLEESDLGPQLMSDPCLRREYTATLVDRLLQLDPAVIVIDSWYNPNNCQGAAQTTQTDKLARALARAVRKTNVVVAVHTRTAEDLKADGITAQGAAELTEYPCLFTPGGPRPVEGVLGGLIRLDPETLQIPTYWTVQKADGTGPAERKSLSLAAASAYWSDLEKHLASRIANAHPFASFIHESQFPTHPASEYTCGAGWNNCNDAASAELKRDTQRRIIVIGERVAKDSHESPFGRIPGFLLQANYIEALLDDRLLKPVSAPLEVLFIIAALVVVELIFRRELTPERNLLTALLLAAVCGLGLFLLIQFGYFVRVWPGLGLAIAGRYVHNRIEAVKEERR